MHFTAGIEIDNWVETKSGWYIGVTLKRTLRERWKQTYTTEAESGGVFREGVSPSHPQLLKRDEFYNKHKISNILWVISEDSDLSEKKITELVSYKHIVLENIGGGEATPQFFRFFIPDNSRVLKNLKDHPEIGKYLFPMTELINQVQKLIET